jgi:hypothetical protein
MISPFQYGAKELAVMCLKQSKTKGVKESVALAVK